MENSFEKYFYLGKVIKPHGFKGMVSAYFETDEPEEYADLKMVFLKMNASPVPFFIRSIHMINARAIIRFEDVNNIEQAERLSGKEMHLPVLELRGLSGNNFYYHEIKGFKVIDKKHGEIGTLNQILEYPKQAIMQIIEDKSKKEILIPVKDEFILKIDRKQKKIHLSPPEGLIEMYLE